MNNSNKYQIAIEVAREVVDIEKEALSKLKDSIDDEFGKCVDMINGISGRVVVTGVGKSSLVGQKIVATLNSTGTPALFMHAADAVHGDLGMLKEEDVVICISKSGETSEIKVLISILKSFGNKLIAMTSKRASFLAKKADFVLFIPIDKEAEPNNLAPTASSVAQMAMGDAIATALMRLKGFSSKQFAKFHPGGSLGKQLYLRVSDIYINNEKPAVQTAANIREVIVEMTSKRLGVAAVIDKNDTLCGIITDGDLRRMLETNIDIEKMKAKDIMTITPKTILEGEFAVLALEIMRNNSITQLIVVDDFGKYKGVVHIHDLIREGIV